MDNSEQEPVPAEYLCDFPERALAAASYTGTEEQVAALREALKNLVTVGREGRRPMTMSTVLVEAGLNTEGNLRYDQTALGRFIDGSTTAPNRGVAAKLYARFVPGGRTIDLHQVPNIFYHATMVAISSPAGQSYLSRVLPGDYFFYRRSAHNPDFYIKGLLEIRRIKKVIHVSELQRHDGSNGIPLTQEVDEGFAFGIGSILYTITRSRELRGATFTVISHYPVRARPGGKGEEVMSLFGFQIGGRDSTPLTASPFAAERIPLVEAMKAREGVCGEDGRDVLGFRDEVPKLLARHFSRVR